MFLMKSLHFFKERAGESTLDLVYNRPSIPRKLDMSDFRIFPLYLSIGLALRSYLPDVVSRSEVEVYLRSKSPQFARGIPRYTTEPPMILDTSDRFVVKGDYFPYTSDVSEVNVPPSHSH